MARATGKVGQRRGRRAMRVVRRRNDRRNVAFDDTLAVVPVSPTTTHNRVGVACGGSLIASTSSAPFRTVSSVAALLESRHSVVDTSARFDPSISQSVESDGATSMLRTTGDRSSAPALVIHSRTSAPRTWYSSTALLPASRTVLKRPISSAMGPRPTSSTVGAGSRGSSNERPPSASLCSGPMPA